MALADALAAAGIGYSATVLQACADHQVPPELVCVLLVKETGGGRNIYGHDQRDGVLAYPYAPRGVDVEVTEANYAEYLAAVAAGGLRNGVGPLQLTHWSLQQRADELGGCWDPACSIPAGVEHFARLLRAYGLPGAFERWRGVGPGAAYAEHAMSLLPNWQRVVQEALMPQVQLIERMAEWVRARDVRVVFEPGWQTRGVNDAGTAPSPYGTWSPRGALMHHTAMAASYSNPAPGISVLNNGRTGLLGPLCHSSGDFDGTVRIHSACRANHGGNARASGPMPAGSANTLYLGHEINYAGTSPMSPEQRHAAVLWAAAFCALTDRGADFVRAHAETSVTGKWDPGWAADRTISMDLFRADVRAALEEDDVSAEEVWAYPIPEGGTPSSPVGNKWPAWSYLRNPVAAISQKVDALAVKLDALAGELRDDEANIVAAVRQIVADDADTEVTVTDEQVNALAARVADALPPSVTEEQMQEAVRRAFARAGTPDPA